MRIHLFVDDENFINKFLLLDLDENEVFIHKRESFILYQESENDIVVISTKSHEERDDILSLSKRGIFYVFVLLDSVISPLTPLPFYVTLLPCNVSLKELRSNIKAQLIKAKLQESLKDEFVGTSEMASTIRASIASFSLGDYPVHIYGETGTGKTLCASLIDKANKKQKNMIYINSANLDSTLAENELFGHTRGAYNGASDHRKGLLEEANGTILFFDEIENLPLTIQSKLLDTIESGKLRPIGSNKETESSFRLITASHDSLEELVKKKELEKTSTTV